MLVIVHTAISAWRMLDAVRLLESDARLQVVFTMAPGVVNTGLEELLIANGGVVMPWQLVTPLTFDAALAADYAAVHEVRAPLLVMPHEASLNRMTRRAVRVAGGGVVYGLDQQRLMRDSRAMPAAILLTHEAERTRLARAHPDLLPLATVTGDSSYDRLVASLPLRDFYRRALGVGAGRKLVVVASTSGLRASSARAYALLRRVVADLPAREYHVLALFPADMTPSRRSGLSASLRHGLSLMPPEADWRAPLVAADWIISDYGPVAPYGAVAGTPVLLYGRPSDDFDANSSLGELAKVAPRLSARRSTRTQLRRAARKYRSDHHQRVIGRITSEPERCNRILRRLLYRTLGLPQPATIPTTDPVSPPFRID
ncbi:MAG TPA: hypothetical protein VFU43_27415 [Streptosporangiaceae bacterium]|nr:hypothetical protein [Streptosporangiaceae bacterium]